MSNSPSSFAGSPALQFVQSRGWQFAVADDKSIRLNVCPYCNGTSRAPFVMEIRGSASDTPQRDGLHICHRCGKDGNLISLKKHLGVATAAEQRHDIGVAGGGSFRPSGEIEPLPDIEAAHTALLEDAEALDYLRNERGFSLDIIKQQKVGLVPKRFFRETGEVRAIVYPYLVNGNCVYVHYRTLPKPPGSANPVPKAFNSPKGWDAPLYNGGLLAQSNLTEIIMVEGEANCIACMDHGVTNVLGVPGANFKRAEWIEQLDKLDPEHTKIYICYDNDRVGQKAAQTLASKIGVERCWKLLLPAFDTIGETGETKPGKDLNEWFTHGGGTAEGFADLKKNATLFDVDGVMNTSDATLEFEDEIRGRGIEPKYKTPWVPLSKLVGFDTGDVIDITAEEKVGKTTFGMNLMEFMVNEYGEDGIVICLEMSRAKLARKWIAHKMGIADNIPKNPEEAEELKRQFLHAIPIVNKIAADRAGTLYFCYPRYKETEEIYKLIRDCIRRYGVSWVMLDNIQRLCDTTPYKNRTEHLSQISKITSQIAKDYGVQMVRIIQPHSIKPGQIATSRDADGASQIRKDCDASMALHRNPAAGVKTVADWESMPYIEQHSAFDNKLLVNVDLTRYSGGGQCTLDYDGARSTIREYNTAAIAAIRTEATKNVGYEKQMAAMNISAPQGDALGAGAVAI